MKIYSLITAVLLLSINVIKKTGEHEPELFVSNIISTPGDEFGGTLSPDGKIFFFSKRAPSTGRSSFLVICYSTLINGEWSKPQVAPFSGRYRDLNPHFSADGSKLFFISNRPVDDKQKIDSDIWVVEKTANGWSEPIHMGANINSNQLEQSCSVTDDGTMYFVSGKDGNSLNVFRSVLVNGVYQPAEMLDSDINTPGNETDVCIAPDESYLLFTAAGRDDGLLPQRGAQYPRTDIYITYKQNNKWTVPKILSEPINSEADESSPFISKDGKTLYFGSDRSFVSIPMKKKLVYTELEKQLNGILNGLGNIWYISTEQLK